MRCRYLIDEHVLRQWDESIRSAWEETSLGSPYYPYAGYETALGQHPEHEFRMMLSTLRGNLAVMENDAFRRAEEETFAWKEELLSEENHVGFLNYKVKWSLMEYISVLFGYRSYLNSLESSYLDYFYEQTT